MNALQKKFDRMLSCPEAVKWLGGYVDPQAAWDGCERGDWMLWAWGRLEPEPRQPLVHAACECARLALPYAKGEQARVCIETTEAWCRGEVAIERVREARDKAAAAADAAAWAAADAADAAAWAAWAAAAADAAAWAAADAADAAAAADADSWAWAAAAADAAAWAAAAADAAAWAAQKSSAAGDAVLRQCADIVRRHRPNAPRVEVNQ